MKAYSSAASARKDALTLHLKTQRHWRKKEREATLEVKGGCGSGRAEELWEGVSEGGRRPLTWRRMCKLEVGDEPMGLAGWGRCGRFGTPAAVTRLPECPRAPLTAT